ncbi:MAG: ATP-binding protein [Ginsengibacter sp.]
MIVIVFGLPGSGKSYFASRFAKMINAGYVNSDKLRKEMFTERVYSDKEKKVVYDTMLEQMKKAVQQNNNLVLDGTFHKKDTRKLFVEEIQMLGEDEILFIEVWADEEIIRERVKKARPYSEADFKVYQFINQHNEPLDEPHLVLQSTNDNLNEMLQRASEYLKIKNDDRTNQ